MTFGAGSAKGCQRTDENPMPYVSRWPGHNTASGSGSAKGGQSTGKNPRPCESRWPSLDVNFPKVARHERQTYPISYHFSQNVSQATPRTAAATTNYHQAQPEAWQCTSAITQQTELTAPPQANPTNSSRNESNGPMDDKHSDRAHSQVCTHGCKGAPGEPRPRPPPNAERITVSGGRE